MLLVADIGNTTVSLGLFRGEKLVDSWRISSNPELTADEHALRLAQLLGRRKGSVREMAIASVVPPLTASVGECARRLFRRDPLIIDWRSPLGFSVDYHPPSDVGADRLANAAAAIHRHGVPVVIVDFGTGINLDVVSRGRAYLGGAIAPGLELGAEALFRGTAKLPQIDLAEPASVIGKSTHESMRAGLVVGSAALVDGLLEGIFRELNERATVIATGGAAHLVVPHCRNVKAIESELTLEGIRLVAARMARRRKK
jgi:type III pantothenate kinase